MEHCVKVIYENNIISYTLVFPDDKLNGSGGYYVLQYV